MALELGGLFAAPVLKVALDHIVSVIDGQIILRKNFEKDLKHMKRSLERVEAVLDHAGKKSITDTSTCLWLKDLKDAMYAISDMIDEFEADTQGFAQLSTRESSLNKCLAVMIGTCLTIGPKFKLANKMESMRDDLEKVTNLHKNFDLVASTNASELNGPDKRETISGIHVQIFGRNEERDRILAYLSQISMTKDCSVLAIYGIGGLGKTTLAQMVYNSPHFKGYSQVWVYVSQTFDRKKIGNSIISQLSENKSQQTDLQMIRNSLSKLLADKKILVVLDDLWEVEDDDWKKLMAMLLGEGSKVIVIVTTRMEDIAMQVSTDQPHKLAFLEDEVCWSIIKQKSNFESIPNKEELLDIGISIARKCGGVALAAQSLGFVLRDKNIDVWRSVIESDLWPLSDLEDSIFGNALASLMLSYSVMPKDLKLCFAYCAIFPKGHLLVKSDLIQQWISLDFIKPTTMRSCWDIGDRCIRQLLGLSFLQNSNSSLTAEVYREDFTLLTMHDLVHDLARSVMIDEILVAGKDGNAGGSCYHYALLNESSMPLDSSKIRALRFMNCGEIELHDASFSSAKSMRVLDLSECSIHKLPRSIGLLKQLRYLNAPRVQHGVIPDSITKLSKLIYLNLHGSQITGLPHSIGDIKGLMYLDLSGCSGIINLPESFGELKNVVHLDLSNCSHVEGVSLFLGSLKKLHYLNLSHCRYIGELPEALGALYDLEYLNLSYSSYLECSREAEILGSLTKLEHLNLSSGSFCLTKIPEAIGNFPKLKYLNLSRSMHNGDQFFYGSGLKVDSFLCSISTLSNLEHLDLSRNRCIASIPESICNLTKLRTLNLSNCGYFYTKIPESIGTMESLKTLYIKGCGLQKLPKLSYNSISLPLFVVHAGDGERSSNLVMLQHTDPDELEIVGLENVKTAVEAQSIELIQKQSMKKLVLEWTSDAGRYVDDKLLLEKLVPPSIVEEFRIKGYNSISFPAWLMDITIYLPNLTSVTVCDMPNCKVLPPMDQLANLDQLVLRDMANLEEWNTSYSSSQEHVISSLQIHDCPKLRIKPLPPRARSLEISNSDSVLSSCGEYTGASTTSSYPVKTTLVVEHCKLPMHQWRLLQHLPGLASLWIIDCRDLTESAEAIQHLSSLPSLRLSHQQEIPKWVGELTSLHELAIFSCSGLTELPQNMTQLSELHSLKLVECNSIVSLPSWLGELTSLKTLQMQECDVINSLPEGIQQLTNLQELNLHRCPALKWCELEKEIMKPTPNPKRACFLPTSIKKLEIIRCHGISSLPEGIEQLTNLQKLVIRYCPALKKWCELEENAMKLAHIEDKRLMEY